LSGKINDPEIWGVSPVARYRPLNFHPVTNTATNDMNKDELGVIKEQNAEILKRLVAIEEVIVNEPTLQSIQDQLNQIERMLLGSTVNPDDFAPGGCKWFKHATIDQIKELNKRRAAEQRRKKK
jgi:hypothetical protein